eukprot:scaffold290714_cov41-Attheya_sp.AAC.1
MTRSSSNGVRCTNYGVYRHAQYKDYGFFFCSPCDLYDTVVEKWTVDSECRRYKCTAGHDSFIFPSSKTKVYVPSKQRDYTKSKAKEAESDSDSVSSSSTSSEEEDADEEEPEVSPSRPPILERRLHSEFSPEGASFSNTSSTPPTLTAGDHAALLDTISRLKAENANLQTELKDERDSQPSITVGNNQKGRKKKKRQTKGEVNEALQNAIITSIMEVLTHEDFSNLRGAGASGPPITRSS